MQSRDDYINNDVSVDEVSATRGHQHSHSVLDPGTQDVMVIEEFSESPAENKGR